MLEANKVPQDVQAMVSWLVRESHVASIVRYHGELLHVASEPFPLQCRLAFLSVFAARQGHWEPVTKRAKAMMSPVASVLASFTGKQDLMSIILAFAAERLRRRVYCEWYDDETGDEL